MQDDEVIHQKRIEEALERCRLHLVNGGRAFQIAEQQLVFLRDFLLGRAADTELLSKINLGLLAAREFEARDMELAELIYSVEDTKSYLVARGCRSAT